MHTGEHFSVLKRKEILTYSTTWMNLEDVMLNEISQSQKEMLHDSTHNEVSKVVKLLETESRMVVARGWGLEKGEKGELFNGYRVSVLQDEKILEICCMTVAYS